MFKTLMCARHLKPYHKLALEVLAAWGKSYTSVPLTHYQEEESKAGQTTGKTTKKMTGAVVAMKETTQQ